jgi:four helix bundle protein
MDRARLEKSKPWRGMRQSQANVLEGKLAEGFGKRSQAEKARFLNIAEGPLEECRYYLILAYDLGYGQTDVLCPFYAC